MQIPSLPPGYKQEYIPYYRYFFCSCVKLLSLCAHVRERERGGETERDQGVGLHRNEENWSEQS